MNFRTSTWIWLASACMALRGAEPASSSIASVPASGSTPSASSTQESAFLTALTQAKATAQRQGSRPDASTEALEIELRTLQKRFPTEAPLYEEWLFLADRSSRDRAVQLASQVLDWPAPAELKDKARGILRKQESLGKPYAMLLPGIDGRILNSSNLVGKVVLIDFWAMWCAPCREALPKLKALLTTRQTSGFEILGINFDDSPKAVRRFVTQEGLGWPQHSVPGGFTGAAARQFGLTRLPSLWLIDKRGRLRELDAGENLEAKVDQLLAEN